MQFTYVEHLLLFDCLLVVTFGIILARQFHSVQRKFSKAQTLCFSYCDCAFEVEGKVRAANNTQQATSALN